MTQRVLLTLAAALALVGWVAGCGSSRGSGAGAKTLTIGFNPTLAQPQALLGAANDAYKAALPGVATSFKSYAAGPELVENLRAGVIDIGCSEPFPAMKAYLKAGDVVLLCGAASGGTQLMVKGDSAIKSLGDLRGRVIGINQLGSTVETMVRYQVLQAGLKPAIDVTFTEVRPSEQADALAKGDVAAVAAPAPWPSFVQIKANARPLLDLKAMYEGGNYLSGSFYATKSWVQANPELARRFIEATRKMTEGLNANRAKSDAQVLAAWEKVTKKTLRPAVARAAFKTIRYTTEAREADLQRFADVNFQLGVIKHKPDVKGFVWK